MIKDIDYHLLIPVKFLHLLKKACKMRSSKLQSKRKSVISYNLNKNKLFRKENHLVYYKIKNKRIK